MVPMRRGLIRCAMATWTQPHFSSAEKFGLIQVRDISITMKVIDTARLFGFAQGSESSDPRDRVFALLCLLPQPLAQRIGTNYSSTVEEVYM
jgi:hypothetical protein